MKQVKKTEQKDKAFLSLSGKSAAGWGGFILFSFVLMFILGTLVGREKIKIDLGQKNLEKEIHRYSVSLINKNTDKLEIIDGTENLIFYESLQKKEAPKLKKQTLKPDKISRLPVKLKKVIKRKKTVYKPMTGLKEKIAEKPQVLKKNSLVYKYSIQVASFKDLEEAKKTVIRFKQQGYQAYYVKALVRESEVWYRVRIGAFKDRIHAKSTLLKLEKNKIEGFLVTR